MGTLKLDEPPLTKVWWPTPSLLRTPLSPTPIYFLTSSWAFVSSSDIVVMFICLHRLKYTVYWPAKQPANIGTLVVEMTNEIIYDDYTMREIKLTNTKVW